MFGLTRFSPLALLVLALSATGGLGLLVVLGLAGLSALLEDWRQEVERAQKLECAIVAERERLDQLERIIRSVIEGRTTLLGAAAHVHELHKGLEVRYPGAAGPYPGLSRAEAACREVIERVRDALPRERKKAWAIAARLEAELERHLKRGALVLPAPPAVEFGG